MTKPRSLFCKHDHNTTGSKEYENKPGHHSLYVVTGTHDSLKLNLGANSKFILKLL